MEGRVSAEIANRLGEWTLGELADSREAVEAMLETRGWAIIDGLLSEMRERRMNALLGHVKPLDQAAYSQELGFLNGLGCAADAARTFTQKADEAVQHLRDEAAREATAERG